MNGPTPTMLAMLRAVAWSRPKPRVRRWGVVTGSIVRAPWCLSSLVPLASAAGERRIARMLRRVMLSLAGALATSCGGGESGITGTKGNPSPNFVRLASDAGDYIGAGETYDYSQANAVLTVTATGGHLSLTIRGDQWWYGDFATPSSITRLQTGQYDAQRYPFNDPAKGGLDWSGEGRGCNTVTGWFAVDSVMYVQDTLKAIGLRFEQHCEGGTTALHGSIHWRFDDLTTPAGPVNPAPAGLWRPAAGSTPSSGAFVYLESEPGDGIGLGGTYSYAAPTSISVSASGGLLSVAVGGWSGHFQAMNTLNQLQPGYYPDLLRYPFHNPTKGGLDWSGNGRGCNTLLGWFVIDGITYTNGALTAVDLRFEQHCDGMTPALHGAMHWSG
jgi:hypothetical protein